MLMSLEIVVLPKVSTHLLNLGISRALLKAMTNKLLKCSYSKPGLYIPYISLLELFD